MGLVDLGGVQWQRLLALQATAVVKALTFCSKKQKKSTRNRKKMQQISLNGFQGMKKQLCSNKHSAFISALGRCSMWRGSERGLTAEEGVGWELQLYTGPGSLRRCRWLSGPCGGHLPRTYYLSCCIICSIHTDTHISNLQYIHNTCILQNVNIYFAGWEC